MHEKHIQGKHKYIATYLKNLQKGSNINNNVIQVQYSLQTNVFKYEQQQQNQKKYFNTTNLIQQDVYRSTLPNQYQSQAHYQNSLPVNWGVRIIPEQQAYIIERFGKFSHTLISGIHLLIPLVDRIAYVHTLKEQALKVGSQTAITQDNVQIQLDGVLYLKIIDPKQASYGVQDPFFAMIQLAQTTMRSELGKISLDKTFEERQTLNYNITQIINEASQSWGIKCMRYEILDIQPPQEIMASMQLQAEAERRKRAQILESEGDKQARINIAEGQKAETVLNSEGNQTATINKAQAEAEAQRLIQIKSAEGAAQAIYLRAEATARGINEVTKSFDNPNAENAVKLKIAEQYIQAFSKLAKESTTILLSNDLGNPASMMTQAMTIYKSLGVGVGVNSEIAQDNTNSQVAEGLKKFAQSFKEDLINNANNAEQQPQSLKLSKN